MNYIYCNHPTCQKNLIKGHKPGTKCPNEPKLNHNHLTSDDFKIETSNMSFSKKQADQVVKNLISNLGAEYNIEIGGGMGTNNVMASFDSAIIPETLITVEANNTYGGDDGYAENIRIYARFNKENGHGPDIYIDERIFDKEAPAMDATSEELSKYIEEKILELQKIGEAQMRKLQL